MVPSSSFRTHTRKAMWGMREFVEWFVVSLWRNE